MVNKILINNCKICGKKGHFFFEKKYSFNEFDEYFKNFYGIKYLEFIKEYLKDDFFSILKCYDCDFIWQKLIPDEEFSNILYEKIIDSAVSFEKSKNLQNLANKKDKFKFNKIFNHYKKKKLNVLDFGAGWGLWLLNLDKNKVNIFAFEISPTRANYLLKSGITILDKNQIKNYNNFFDYIRLEQVLEHIPDLKECMDLIKTISKKGTLLEIGVPNGVKEIKNAKNIKINKGPIQPLEHLNCFSNRSLKKFIKLYDFEPFTIRDIFDLYFDKSIFSIIGLKTFLKETFDNFFSTSIKFKIKK